MAYLVRLRLHRARSALQAARRSGGAAMSAVALDRELLALRRVLSRHKAMFRRAPSQTTPPTWAAAPIEHRPTATTCRLTAAMGGSRLPLKTPWNVFIASRSSQRLGSSRRASSAKRRAGCQPVEADLDRGARVDEVVVVRPVQSGIVPMPTTVPGWMAEMTQPGERPRPCDRSRPSTRVAFLPSTSRRPASAYGSPTSSAGDGKGRAGCPGPCRLSGRSRR